MKETKGSMFDAPPTVADPLQHLEVLEGLRPPTTWKVFHPLHGVCRLERRGGPSSLDFAERKWDLLDRLPHESFSQPLELIPLADGGTALISRFLEGVSLDRADHDAFRASPARIAELGIELLRILDRLHGRGIVHGRIEAKHIIVGDRIGLVGLSPDNARGVAETDRRAVGAVLYELATARPWSEVAPPVAYYHPQMGRAFDDWLNAFRGKAEPFASSEEAIAVLRAVSATMPHRVVRQRTRSSVRAPRSAGSMSLLPAPKRDAG